MKSVRKMVMIPYDQYERWKSSKEENAQVNYTSFTESSTKDKDESKEPQQNNDMHTYSNEEDMPEDMILMGMPKAFYRKAKSLLQHIKTTGQIKWNKRGEVIIKGKMIPNSHIFDLIRDAMKEYQSFKPTGKQEFYAALYDSNVPTSLLHNSKRLNEPQSGKGEQIPPGIPDIKPNKKRKKATETSVKWTKL